MSFAIRVQLTTAMLVCMSWCLPARAQETVSPAGRTTARSTSPIAAAGAVLDPAQAVNWAYRNGIALSIAAAGTAGQDNPTPQAEPSSPVAPERSRLHPTAKHRRRWTAARIGVLAAGVGLTGAGAYLLATGSTVTTPAASNCGSNAPNPGGLPGGVTCGVSSTRWDGQKKAGVVLLGIGAPLSIAGLLVH
jgi:hypothetical protein